MTQFNSSGKPIDNSGKPKGWFSRKHPTPAEHTEARNGYLATRGPAARRQRAAERASRAARHAEMAKAIDAQEAAEDV